MNSEKHTRFVFGNYTLDHDREALFENDVEIRLRPKCFKVLRLLVERHGRLVTKSELHLAAWSSSIVTDDSLAHCLIEIRRALGDHDHKLIRTVPRRGYIFEPAVTAQVETPVSAGTPQATSFFPKRARITATGFFVLAGVAGIASQNHVAATLPGPAHATFEEEPVYSTADTNTADSSAEELAYPHYLKGMFFYDRRGPGDLDRAEEALSLAVTANPLHGDAWTGLAAVHNIRLIKDDVLQEEALLAMGDAAHRALALDPDSAEALVRMACYYMRMQQYRLAETYFARAVEIEPSNPLVLGMMAGQLLKQVRVDEAIELQKRAVAQDPLSVVNRNNLVTMLMIAGRTTEALAEFEQLAELNPGDERGIAGLAAELYVLVERYADALPMALQQDDELDRNRTLAMIYHGLGSDAQATAALEQLVASEDDLAPFHVAAVFGHRGQHEEALRWLYRAGEVKRWRSLPQDDRHERRLMLLSPFLSSLRSDPRWQVMFAATRSEGGDDNRLTAMASGSR